MKLLLVVRPHECVALVGESGSGKSVTAQALLGLIELPGRIVGGDVRWKGESLVHGDVAATIERIRRAAGDRAIAILQDLAGPKLRTTAPVGGVPGQCGHDIKGASLRQIPRRMSGAPTAPALTTSTISTS